MSHVYAYGYSIVSVTNINLITEECNLKVIILLAGQILETLRHEKLGDYAGGQLSMHEGVLAVPCKHLHKVRLFRLLLNYN